MALDCSRWVIFIGWTLISLNCSRPTFSTWGLPEDLPEYMGQLDTLKLPRRVTRLDWIRPGLRELDASGTSVSVVSSIPWGLESLKLGGLSQLTSLPPLPPSLRELDISSTDIEGPWRLPRDLESLVLGGGRVETLDGLNEALLELTLSPLPNLGAISGLPDSIQSLSITEAPKLESLVELPSHLKTLYLANTRIRALKSLPLTLQDLSLIGHEGMEVELPPYLESLTLHGDYPGISGLEQLSFLSRLDAPDVSLESLPSLVLLQRISFAGAADGLAAATSLRYLKIVGEPRALLLAVPPRVEDLQWSGATDLSTFPGSLKRLGISGSLVNPTGPLYRQLESIDISGTHLGLAQLPPSLHELVFRFFPGTHLEGLGAKFPSLRSLDLAGSATLERLQGLPGSLEYLDISGSCISRLPLLPASLRNLNISRTPIQTLENLREGLRSLTLHAGQLRSLRGLPKSVSKLYFVEAQAGSCH